MPVVISCFCNSCARDTDHAVVWADTFTVDLPDGSGTGTRYQALRCGGCKECTLKKEKLYFSGIPDPDEPGEEVVETIYRPARLWRRAPDWVNEIEYRDADLKGLLDEVYSATNDKQVRLLSMGVRSALDHVMTKILGGDIGPFDKKLEAMVQDGHLTKKQKENLNIVIDAGSASTHRGFKPSKELLDEMITVMESIIRDHYITGPMLNTAKLLIPPRPPRPSTKQR
jgi:hypothetical protein